MDIRRQTVLVVSGLVMCGLACSSLIPGPPRSTSEATQPPPTTSVPLSPSPTAIEPGATPSSPAVAADRELSRTGPWIVFVNESGIWGLNDDGTDLTQLADPVYRPHLVSAPAGGRFAYIVGHPSGDPPLNLQVYSIPLRKDVAVLPLTPALTEADLVDNAWTADDEAMLSIFNSDMAWSPDGRTLAFVGAIDGKTADIYTYSVESGEVSRVSSGPLQAAAPSWSPDGKYIVHFEQRFPGPVDTDMWSHRQVDGVYAARADGSAVVPLEAVDIGMESTVQGWDANTPSRFYVTDWEEACGPTDLQQVDIETGQVLNVWEGWVSSAGVKPNGDEVALTGADECGSPSALIRWLPGQEIDVTFAGDARYVAWLKETRVGHSPYAATETFQGWFLLNGDAEPIPLNRPEGPAFSIVQAPGSDVLLWKGESLWMSSLEDPSAEPVQIFDQHVRWVFASDGADHLVFFADGEVWAAFAESGYQPLLRGIAGGIQGWPVWVED